jgi:spermidine/putrescine transport system substrate-binding protein
MPQSLIRLLSLAAALLLIYLPLASQAAERQLVILNWADYLDPELVEKFEQRYEVQVIKSYYSSDDNRTQKLVESNASGYDLILVAGVELQHYLNRQWISPLDSSLLPNMQHIDPKWRSTFEAAEIYGVPYFWGTTGIAYRSDLLPTPITSWLQLFRPAPELQGKVAMIKDARDLIGMGLKALSYSANSSDPDQLRAAEALLMEQKPFVRSYDYISLDETSPLITGDIAAALMYSGDALMLKELNEDLRYIVPQEGGGIWVDYFTIAKQAQEPELAYAFLNFINEPGNAAQQAQFVHYATPNRAAEALLPKEFLRDPIIYPDQASLKSSEFFVPQPAKAQRLRNAISARVLR